jgi:seryl-tRNA synthetase
MLEIRFIRENRDLIDKALKARGNDLALKSLLKVDSQRRKLLQEVEDLRNLRNRVSEKIGRQKKERKDTGELLAQMKKVASKIKELNNLLKEKEISLNEYLFLMPNIPHPSVPVGRDETENPVIRTWGDILEFEFKPVPHWEVGERLDILDLERAAKIAGARFAVYRGLGAKLERALINFMLDLHQDLHGYTEILPPFIVNKESLVSTGQLPKFADDLFKLENWNYYLVPTAEVPITNLHRDEILDEEILPIYYMAYTPCFRSEAGSYGKDTRGIVRQHQFNKVELVKFCQPENSYTELESLLLDAEEVLQKLNLPYRTIELCTGDLGFSASKTYDIEVWLPGQNRFCEISSCSNFEAFQARRANIRYRPKGQAKTRLLHTLNGSGLAVGRTLVAILENYQQEDGSVLIPEALIKYMRGVERIARQ